MSVIHWPSIIKYTGEDELGFVGSQEEWSADADLHAFAYEPEDILIDSDGAVFRFDYENDHVHLQPKLQAMDLGEVVELIRKHASQLGSCCIAKIAFPTVQLAVLAVSEMQD